MRSGFEKRVKGEVGAPSLRIAFLTPEFVSEEKFDGGLANYLYRTARGLQSYGHHVEVFVLADRDERLYFEDILVHRVKRRPLVTWNRLRRWVRRIKGPNLSYSCYVRDGAVSLAQALDRRCREQTFDVVQTSDFGATALALPDTRTYRLVSRLSWYAPHSRRASGVPLTLDRAWVHAMERRSIRKSDAIYGPSHRVARVVSKAIGRPVSILRPPGDLVVSENGLDDSVFRSGLYGKSYVLFYGRICRLKGVYPLARAMHRILERNPDMLLVLAGREDPPGIVDELRLLLGQYSDRLMHFQRLRHPQLFPIIRNASCVALPSLVDNFPNVCIEAILNNQVVIGTREASFDEMIEDSVSGYLVSAGDPNELALAIEKALSLRETDRCRMLEKARHSIRDFDTPTAITELVGLYHQTLACEPPAGSGRRTRNRRILAD